VKEKSKRATIIILDRNRFIQTPLDTPNLISTKARQGHRMTQKN